MNPFEKLDVEVVSDFLESNRDGLSDQEFVNRYISGVMGTLQSNPLLYRSFGTYWWALKRLILNSPDYSGFIGDNYDKVLSRAFSYQSDALTVCAAYLIQQQNLGDGYMNSIVHYAFAGSESFEINIEDSEIEARTFSDSFGL